METPLPEHAGACSWTIAPACDTAQAPYQLTFSLSPDAEALQAEPAHAAPQPSHTNNKHPRRRTCRNLTPADVASFDNHSLNRPLLRTSAGAILPALYARTPVIEQRPGNTASSTEQLAPADADIIIDSATALLAHRLRRGVRILRDPQLLLRFLQLRLVSQPCPVFGVFFLDRHQQLIRFAELFHGQNEAVTIHTKEVVRETLACNAEQILCVRSDPQGDHQPTPADVEDARRLARAMQLLHAPVLDYVIVGTSVTSLRACGVLRS